MANYSSKSRVPVAVKTRSQMDLSHITISSQDFGNIVPISCQYLVPGDEFNIKVSEFTRVLPMVNPTFAKVDSIVRGFVVPIQYIWNQFNEFIKGGTVRNQPFTQSSFAPHAPWFSAANLRKAFINTPGLVEDVTDYYDEKGFDFKDVGDTDTLYYKFTLRGKKVYKNLISLGYNLAFDNSSNGTSYNAIYSDVHLSALPFMAMWKFYLDWVVPARFLDQYGLALSLLNGSINLPSNGELNYIQVANLVSLPFDSFLDNDYFTAAWNEPNQYPNNSLPSFKQIEMSGDINAFVSAHKEGGAIASDDYLGNSNLSALSVQSLGRLQSMINRNMIAGDKIKDWLKVEFGIEPNLDALQMSTYLGMFRNTMRISDIMSTADTAETGGVPLGSYAGRALVGGDGTFSYKAKQHCILILTHEIIPKPLYFQGLHPVTQLLDRMDFFIPEYDNLGTRAIKRSELYSGTNISGSIGGEGFMSQIFGFAPQYANLKSGRDIVTGDFRLHSLENSMSSWFLGRKFTPNEVLNSTPQINMTFCKVNGTTQASYDDMFAYQGTDIDHFYSLFDISIRANRPMVSISDALTLDEEMNDRKVSVSTNNNPNV